MSREKSNVLKATKNRVIMRFKGLILMTEHERAERNPSVDSR